MQKKPVLIGIGIIIVALGVYFLTSNSPTLPSPIKRRVSYGFEVKNNSNSLLENIEVQVFAPLQSTPFQNRLSISSTPKSTLRSDSLSFFLTIPPYGTKVLTIKSKLELFPRAYIRGGSIDITHLKDEPYVDLNNQGIEPILPEIQKETPLLTSQSIFEWIRANISHAGYLKKAKGTVYALTERKGDCTEFAALFTALARRSGIPTKAVSGFYVERDRFLRPIEYHTWNEAFIDDNWHLFDAHRGNALKDSDKYIAFGSVTEENSSEIAPLRFRSSNPQVSVRMR